MYTCSPNWRSESIHNTCILGVIHDTQSSFVWNYRIPAPTVIYRGMVQLAIQWIRKISERRGKCRSIEHKPKRFLANFVNQYRYSRGLVLTGSNVRRCPILSLATQKAGCSMASEESLRKLFHIHPSPVRVELSSIVQSLAENYRELGRAGRLRWSIIRIRNEAASPKLLGNLSEFRDLSIFGIHCAPFKPYAIRPVLWRNRDWIEDTYRSCVENHWRIPN